MWDRSKKRCSNMSLELLKPDRQHMNNVLPLQHNDQQIMSLDELNFSGRGQFNSSANQIVLCFHSSSASVSDLYCFISLLSLSSVQWHKNQRFNSVWLPLVDVVEYSVVFAPKVFVQSFGVSCHCGLQSTVVHSRVRQLKLLDLQRNWSDAGIDFSPC